MNLPGFTRLAAASLFLLGCNLPSAIVLSFDEANLGDVPAQVGLDVRFQPGLPLLNAAAEAPAAFSRLRGAAARLDFGQLSLGEASTILEGELLHKGMLIPLPAGVLTIRTIAPEAAAVPSVATASATDAPLAVLPLPVRQLPELIGAYSAGRRTLVLATDGSFLLFGPAEPFLNGTFFLVGSRLELHPRSGDRRAFEPTGIESWRDSRGEVWNLIHETPIYDSKPAGKGRGGR
jgi:hypothetical protein